MKNILLLTDFSASSQNAAEYICRFMGEADCSLTLQHIFITPVNYASEGIAMVSYGDAYEDARQSLEDQVDDVMAAYPLAAVSGNITTGYTVAEAMDDALEERQPDMIVMGAITDYTGLWDSGEDLLKLLINLDIPVLLVPSHAAYKPLKNIGFACDYRRFCAPAQLDFIKWLITFTRASLHVVHVTRGKEPDKEIKQRNEAMLNEALAETLPNYHSIESQQVVDAIAQFVKDKEIDMLIVVPHKYGAWHSIFHQSYTKQLARLNHLPILALHD